MEGSATILTSRVYNHQIVNKHGFITSVDVEFDDVFSIRVIDWNLGESHSWIKDIFNCFLIFVDY